MNSPIAHKLTSIHAPPPPFRKHEETGNWCYLRPVEVIRKEENFNFVLEDERVEQCLRCLGTEFQTWGPKQEKAEAIGLA